MKLYVVTVRKGTYRPFKSYLSVCVSVCVSANNAVSCALHVLSAIKPAPSYMYIGISEVTLWLGHYCDARLLMA